MNGVVITAKDEAETIGKLVKALRGSGLSVCVVDDGSNDETGTIARYWGAHVIRHDVSQGIGKSLMEAWWYAIEQGWDYTLQIDAGGSHEPNFYVTDADIAIGSRFLPLSQYIGRSWRAIASRTVAALLNFATHQKISDWTSGYRVFSRKALEILVRKSYMTNMHTWQIEVLHEAIRAGLKIAEFPITYRAGNSTLKLKTVDDLIKVYLWIFNQ